MRVAELWLNSRDRRQYEGVDFAPAGQAEPGHYNLWTGWGVEPKDGCCEKFLAHIFNNVCGGNEDYYRYVLAWFADIIQNPAKLKGVALVLRGHKGTGKSKVAEVMRKIIGRHSITVSHGEQLIGKFNAHLVSKMLIVAEESFWSGDKRAEGPLKHMITAGTATVEMKGKDSFEVPSFSRVMLITNSEWAVPATSDERRYAVFDVGDTNRGDHAYFAAIDAEMAKGGYEALFTLLQKFDLSTVDLRKVPETAGLRAQRERSLEPHDQFVLDMLGGLSVRGTALGDGAITLAKEAVYRAYTDHARAQGRTHLLGYDQFCKKFAKVTGATATRLSTKGRERAFLLLSHKEVQEHFAAYAKIDVKPDKVD